MTVSNTSGSGLFVNQRSVSRSCPLRSGDIIRLSWCGPDVQFFLQSGTPTINELASKYLPSKKRDDTASCRDHAAKAGTPRAAGPSGSSRETLVLENPAARPSPKPAFGISVPAQPAAPQAPAAPVARTLRCRPHQHAGSAGSAGRTYVTCSAGLAYVTCKPRRCGEPSPVLPSQSPVKEPVGEALNGPSRTPGTRKRRIE